MRSAVAELPDTHLSLILRLPKSSAGGIDQTAWQEFAESYEPFLYRFARRRGLQDADAHELVQRVMVSVANSVQRWEPTSERESRPRFRNWLFTIARNQLINILRASGANLGVGGTTQVVKLREDVTASNSEMLEDDLRYEMFLWAATRVKCQVEAETWRAFWLTAVEGQGCKDVAMALGVSVGSVYVARSRVLARIRNEIDTMSDDQSACVDEVNGGMQP